MHIHRERRERERGRERERENKRKNQKELDKGTLKNSKLMRQIPVVEYFW